MVRHDDLASDASGNRLASPLALAGVIGIVAARLVERYHRPAILIALSADGGGRIRSRSISGFDLAGALTEYEEHLIAHGGHAMAAGLRIAPDRVEAFRRAFVEVANRARPPGDLQPEAPARRRSATGRS